MPQVCICLPAKLAQLNTYVRKSKNNKNIYIYYMTSMSLQNGMRGKYNFLQQHNT